MKSKHSDKCLDEPIHAPCICGVIPPPPPRCRSGQHVFSCRMVAGRQCAIAARDRALATAFLRARLDTDYTYAHAAVRWDLGTAARALARLDWKA